MKERKKKKKRKKKEKKKRKRDKENTKRKMIKTKVFKIYNNAPNYSIFLSARL